MGSSSLKSITNHTWSYDVFVSYEGGDIIQSFVDHLFHDFKRKGIRAFKEDDHMRRGEERYPQVYRAIEQSRFPVVILSDGFASSPYCLRELVKIIEYKEKLQEKYEITIIYHNCKPEMVVKETENYEATFGKHEKLVKQDVSKWKEALIKAVSLPGWDLKRLANGLLLNEKTIESGLSSLSLPPRSPLNPRFPAKEENGTNASPLLLTIKMYHLTLEQWGAHPALSCKAKENGHTCHSCLLSDEQRVASS
nr:NB-ARC domains-containing protein [Tanacetum cinerariifolium]